MAQGRDKGDISLGLKRRAEVKKVSVYEYDAEKHIRMEREEALEEGREEGRKEGRKEGLEEGLERGAKALIKMCREYSCTREEACSRLMQEFSISSEEAEKYLEKYWIAQP